MSARRTQLIAGAALLAFLAGSVGVSQLLSASVGRHKLSYTVKAEDGQPPQVALGIAMGAFRGIFVNFLWMRANEMKEAGRFQEATELARAITKLQPRFPRAWTFHAWNLAYNISVTTQTLGERWQWVNDGIRLLRDEAIKANPNDLHIHKELAWIYLHKIQGFTDDANLFYKKKVAEEWHAVLGAPPRFDPAIRNREQAMERFANWLEPVANAPESLELAVELEPTVQELVDRLSAEAKLKPDYQLLEKHALIRAMQESGRQKAYERVMGPNTQAMLKLVDDPKLAKAWSVLLPHVRKRVVIDTYKMDPAQMIRYTRKYGPIDWRHPAAHALYWAAIGVEKARGRIGERNEKDFDFVNTDRIAIQSVQELWRSGEIFFDYLGFVTNKGQANTFYLATVEPNFIETYGDILEELRSRSKTDDLFARGWTFYSAGYENFLRDVVRYLYRRGDVALAEKYYQRIRTFAGQNLNDPFRGIDLSVPIEQFVRGELVDRQDSPAVAVQEIAASLYSAYISLMAGDSERFRVQFKYAADFHKYFVSKQYRFNAVSFDDARMGFVAKNFPAFAGTFYAQFVSSLPLSDAERVYTLSPQDLQLYGYMALEAIKGPMNEEAKSGGRKFEDVFPEPPNYQAFRKRLEAEAAKARLENPAEAK